MVMANRTCSCKANGEKWWYEYYRGRWTWAGPRGGSIGGDRRIYYTSTASECEVCGDELRIECEEEPDAD